MIDIDTAEYEREFWKRVEWAAANLCEAQGFGYYTDPMEGGQDAYDISRDAVWQAQVVLMADDKRKEQSLALPKSNTQVA